MGVAVAFGQRQKTENREQKTENKELFNSVICKLSEQSEVNMFKADIYITLKKTVADPQGLTIKHALESLNYKEVQEVRIGKIISVTLNIKDKKEAEKRLDEMCRKLLVSPIIEDYSFNIKQN